MQANESDALGALVSIAAVLVGAALIAWRSRTWRRFARDFAHRGAAPPGAARFQNATAFGTSFRGLLTVGADATGLYVAPSLPPVRWLFPAILVPWTRVFPAPPRRVIFEMRPFVLGTPDGPTLELFTMSPAFRVVEPYLGVSPLHGTSDGDRSTIF